MKYLTAIASFVLVAGIIALASFLGTLLANDNRDWRMIGPCATEDSENCYWDAAKRGDGTGVSFIDWHGVTYYEGVTK